ncbi:glycoside hydrolase family 57 protein [Luteolibacter algae]|uniref:Glycoside hydrolase family 57 protein n=1 Tax=Luteolibacter algae TaxID=454151 RepID=A0ABW5D6M5_9BACT
MPDVCLYFQVHQPHRLISPQNDRTRLKPPYEDDALNREILNRVSDKCYLPANKMFKQRIEESHGLFRMALSLSGTVVEQFKKFRPDVLESFQELVATGGVELLAETYYHSLAFVYSDKEFQRQVDMHLDMLEENFSVRPRVFRNSELIYNNSIAAKAETLGFEGIIAEGTPAFTEGISPNYLYRAPDTARIKTLMRNHTLSNDLAFRFSDSAWGGYPLTWEKFTDWVGQSPGDLVNLFMDYESIGEHQKAEKGIYEFWQKVPEVLIEAGSQWVTPSEAVSIYPSLKEYDCAKVTSWADAERDLSAWYGNAMQQEAMAKIRELEPKIVSCGDPVMLATWGRLQSSDHPYWMSTKGGADGDVKNYFSPYKSAEEAYRTFMDALADLEYRLQACAVHA